MTNYPIKVIPSVKAGSNLEMNERYNIVNNGKIAGKTGADPGSLKRGNHMSFSPSPRMRQCCKSLLTLKIFTYIDEPTCEKFQLMLCCYKKVKYSSFFVRFLYPL